MEKHIYAGDSIETEVNTLHHSNHLSSLTVCHCETKGKRVIKNNWGEKNVSFTQRRSPHVACDYKQTGWSPNFAN